MLLFCPSLLTKELVQSLIHLNLFFIASFYTIIFGCSVKSAYNSSKSISLQYNCNRGIQSPYQSKIGFRKKNKNVIQKCIKTFLTTVKHFGMTSNKTPFFSMTILRKFAESKLNSSVNSSEKWMQFNTFMLSVLHSISKAWQMPKSR